MAKLTLRTQLVVGTNLIIDETAKTFELLGSVDGSTTNGLIPKDGVSFPALYSKFVDLWTTGGYQDSPFPVYAIDRLSGQFQFGTDGSTFNGWKPANDATRQMLRDAGWTEYSASGVVAREYVGIVGLGTVSSGAQLYYQKTSTATPVNFTFTDQANEGIQVIGNATVDPTTTTFDSRAYFKGFVREYGKKYKDSVLADTGKTSTGAFIVNLLLSNEDDLKIQANDAAMSGAPYSGITISYYTADQQRTIGGAQYPFRVIIDGAGATLEQIYTKVQYLLRQNVNINTAGTAGTITGKTAAALLAFLGDTLETSVGVYIDNVAPADSNRVVFKDQNGVPRTNPYIASGSITFNSFLIGAGSSFRLMYAAPPGAGDDYGESGAVTVLDYAGAPIAGTITAGVYNFSFDYDGNTQAGFTAGTDRPVVLMGIRPGSGKFAVSLGTLTRSKNISLALVAEQDRAYVV
jgi:hypothetical protein